ncbi:hypothetical protein DOTSEDRAFT_63082 [Dothistroma septosporum NZE10]|uniref:Ammonium transporter AmtB-like domain-containing protein n=1 Tax=Dothistroma septosporum (strain NZE10 / CBS 128990) TaxID=675120 RepID=N1PMW0_DOTSN|nr:hypothetical protein DOTSEDRAFT_63082 [Dothistroma septosporum NZE10]
MANNLTSATPDWLVPGDNAWQLTAASLVALQSIPGLMLLYAGIVKRKWAINSMFMVFYAFAAVLFCWVLWATRLPFAGRPGPVVTMTYELRQSYLPSAGLSQNYPLSTMIYFQFVFAAITLVLIAGAYLARMNLTAWMLFLGVIDYSGGYVIHLSSGTAAFAGSYWIGPRLARDRINFQPNNVGLIMAGAGILWIGWNGFNGGDPYAASPDAGSAVLNTNLCTAVSLLVWTSLDVLVYKKPAIIGSVNGMITGLVAITPAAGVVTGWGAIIIGVCSGSIPWASMNFLARKTKLFTVHLDDVLGVTHTHMVAGFLGGFLVGIFADSTACAAFGLSNPGGAIDGNGRQIWVQIVGGLFIIGWNLVWTSLIMLFIKHVCRVPLRMTEEQLLIGDDAVHGEQAYCFASERRHLPAIDNATALVS